MKQWIKNRRFLVWLFGFSIFFFWRIGVFIHQKQVFDFLTIVAVPSAKNRPDNCRGSEPVSNSNCPTTLVWNSDNFFTGKISPKNEINFFKKMK
jgi:hypothetical protein